MTAGPTNGPNKRKEQIAMLMLADKAEEVAAPSATATPTPAATATPTPVAVVADAYRFVVGVDTHARFHCYAIVEAAGSSTRPRSPPVSPVWPGLRTGSGAAPQVRSRQC